TPADRARLEETEKKTSVFELLETWLSRMPFSQFSDFDFWGEYAEAVEKMLKADHEIISKNPSLSENLRNMELKNLEMTKETFATLLDAHKFESWKAQGKVRLSQRAML